MRETPISILQKADNLGLTLGFKPPDTLDVKASNSWPKAFAELLSDHKPQLLALLELPFVMVYSESLGETIFFCADEDTKAALVQAGAEEWSIYTKAELRTLVAQNRVKPFTDAELNKVHELKRTLNARIHD